MSSPDPLAVWCTAHPEELQAFAGQYVALSPKGGILAHGTDFFKVHQEASRKEPEAVYQLVPDAEVMVLWLR